MWMPMKTHNKRIIIVTLIIASKSKNRNKMELSKINKIKLGKPYSADISNYKKMIN